MSFDPVLPWWVMAPLAAAAVLALGWVLVRSGPGTAGFRGWRYRAGLVLLLLLAACRPGVPGGTVQAAAADLDVFFVVDTSSSIAGEDFLPSGGRGTGVPRIDGVRADIRTLAQELAGARYSLISFDSGAVVRLPLTTDASALETTVAILTPQVTAYSQGSSVTAARTVLAERLTAARDSHPDRPRLVFYLGDGEQTSGAAAQAFGIDGSLVSGGAVLGYGTREGGRMKENTGDPIRPADTYIRDPATGTDALSRVDEDQLRDLARQLAVPYVHRAAGDPAGPMLQKATTGTLSATADSLDGKTELYWLPAMAAFLLALRETLLVSGQLRELGPVRRSPAGAPSAPAPPSLPPSSPAPRTRTRA